MAQIGPSVPHLDTGGFKQWTMAYTQAEYESTVRSLLHHCRGRGTEKWLAQINVDDPTGHPHPAGGLSDRIAAHQSVVSGLGNEDSGQARVLCFTRQTNQIGIGLSQKRRQ